MLNYHCHKKGSDDLISTLQSFGVSIDMTSHIYKKLRDEKGDNWNAQNISFRTSS